MTIAMNRYSDQTTIRGTSWGSMKTRAMQPGFENTSEFKMYTQEERDTLRVLIQVQRNQGDMFELRVDKVIERPATVSSQPMSSLPTRPITA